MSKRNVGVMLAIFLLLGTGVAFAQQQRGEIHGAVYEDVNGDGLCFDTGVEGEGPVENIELEFVSSDEAVILNLVTGEDGTYGLVAAGQSVWRVTANPDSTKWVVTSEKTRYPPVLPESLIQTDVNFCVQKVDAANTTDSTSSGNTTSSNSGNAVIILPESGAAKDTTSLWLYGGAIFGLALIGFGILLEIRRRTAS
jgi:hypothetical protein